MRAVVQRVSRASVSVEGDVAAKIDRGLLVFLGVSRDDSPADASWIAGKIARLRICEDEDGRMNLSLADTGGKALVVSQFTLLGDAGRGNRPSFTAAADPGAAEELYLQVADGLRRAGIETVTGVFGATMAVELVNDGPVTLILDSYKQSSGNHQPKLPAAAMPKKRKPKPSTPRKPRSPFAGRRQTGAGYHSGKKYGKKDRRRLQDDLEEETKPEG